MERLCRIAPFGVGARGGDHPMIPPRWINEIDELSRGLPVLLLEGKDDILFFQHFLNQHTPTWRLRLHIAAANSKMQVIQCVTTHRPHWLGIVDSDEWSPEDVLSATQGSPRLKLLPRFCSESYFCHPDELWATLPPLQRARVKDSTTFAQPIWDKLPDWVAHGALWRVLRRLYQAAKLPEELERAPITDEGRIRAVLQAWHEQLSPDTVLNDYHTELARARSLSRDEQITRYIHGKKFFNQVVVQYLDQTFAGKGADDWLQKFYNIPLMPPEDLHALLNWIISLV